MKRTTIAALAAASYSSTALALVGLTWHFPNSPDQGTQDVVFPISVPDAPHVHGMYFAQQFYWVGNDSHTGYTGLQPQADVNGSPVIRALFSTFDPGATTNDPNCSLGADSGGGVSCAVYISETYAGTYGLTVTNTGGNTWEGTAVHTATGTQTHIGSWTLPKDYGGIYGYDMGFVEWIPFNSESTNDCSTVKYTTGIFGVPFSVTNSTASEGANLHAPYEYGNCVGKVNFSTKNITGTMEIEVGFK